MISRDELYQLVWSKPMTKVAEQFDVSGSYLARICTLLNVPRPERGYWAKAAVGKAPAQLPLQPPQPGDPRETLGRKTRRFIFPIAIPTGLKSKHGIFDSCPRAINVKVSVNGSP
jgi:hypothetical protein